MPELMQTMIDHFMQNVDDAGTGLRVLPGVASLLTYLKVTLCMGHSFGIYIECRREEMSRRVW